ncbi:type III-A CRISPR-associated protein Csm2 [Sulfuricurvum sp.]|uniref:type III-A CRISPR-associated protein Csm2 n=1 Tax=Sulfuricurvum sp. TaxID=2025608 RepID=UPI0026171A8D|nr:type III-A CRISPR-associated protein Csm2 [Sulfuricurvum sp.]MDD3596350.1 type III-A CRISPR-associated protein Csm2 [Sulfuricurvum sp.]
MKGNIKQLKDNYGFIQTSHSKDWYWFGFRGLDIVTELYEGLEVEFDEAPGKDGKKSAKNIRLLYDAVPQNKPSAMPQTVADTPTSNDIRILCRFELDGVAPHMNLFSANAKKIADLLGREHKKNSPSQLRRFYDQLVRYYDEIRFQPTPEQKLRALEKSMPYILMLESRVHEAHAKEKIDGNFKLFIDTCIAQLRVSPTFDTLKIFKTLFEAVVGFYKS